MTECKGGAVSCGLESSLEAEGATFVSVVRDFDYPEALA